LLSFGVTFAQATLYGNVDQAWNKQTVTTAGVVSSDKTGFAPIQMGGGILGVKGSEDLAAGLKANYVIELQNALHIGMLTLREDGQRLVQLGITSAQELLRVTRE